ncbi:hypothetical protein LJC20_00425 [Eubacteriales bacterium OttesenSCG-928-M02]|nr:hypothetical protein [Eubacteriales bacterium OttesenSCG-928-M02]
MTREHLRQYRRKELEMQQLEESMARLRARMEGPALPSFSFGRKVTTHDRMEEMVLRYNELMEQYNETWDALLEERGAVEDFISGLGDTERILMRYRYIDGLSWRKIADIMGYSEDWVRQLHSRLFAKTTHQNTKISVK